MKLNDLKANLKLHPAARVQFVLPDGDAIPPHFHITEVGHVAKRFIDCGGTLHDTSDTCLLQTYVADDLEHRLDAATFAKILDLGRQVLPHEDLEVEVEYDCCVVAQYPLEEVTLSGNHFELRLGAKHTDCLAKAKCRIDGGCGEAVAEAVSAGCC